MTKRPLVSRKKRGFSQSLVQVDFMIVVDA